MPTSQDQRPRYYEGQYLGADDLTAAVAYGRWQDARHALGAHTWGIAMGLQLKVTPQPGGRVDVHIMPGYAWDGFGRPIVVLAPAKIPAEKFSDYKFDATIDTGPQGQKGRLIEIWLRYDETATQDPRRGFEVCDPEDQRSRVQETFRIEVGRRNTHPDQHDPILLVGQRRDAREALQRFDPTAPLVYDESVPHQMFPEEGERDRWLIPIGYVRWLPVAGQAGHFVSWAIEDAAEIRRFRRYIGVVAEEVAAADGAIRLRDRTKDPAASLFSKEPTPSFLSKDPAKAYYQAPTPDLVWVEGSLHLEGDIRLAGGSLDFRDREGKDHDTPLLLQRLGDAGKTETQKGGRTLQLLLGPEAQTDNRLAVGTLKDDGTLDVKFAILSDGNVGIGTSTPGAKLEINAGDLLFKAVAEAPGDIIFQSFMGAQKGRIWSKPTVGAGLFLSSGDKVPDIAIDASGNIGIGTETPTNKLHVNDHRGIRQNRLYLSGGDGWSSLTYNAYHNAANNAWVFPDPTHNAMTMEMDDHSGIPRFEVFSNLAADPFAWRSRLKIFGDTGNVVMAHNGGNVGIGTAAPNLKLDIQGDFGRSNGPTTLNLWGARIGDVGSGILFIRAFSGGTVAFDGTNNKVGIGLNSPSCKLHVVDSINASANNVNAHVAVIENTNLGNNANVLALKIGASAAPSLSNNFITFFAGNTAVGSIEGNPADLTGGIRFNSTGADFAECLPRLHAEEVIEAGDVVGVFAGKITKVTRGAHHVMAITGKPVVLANAPHEGQKHLYGEVAFLGQVPVKIRGPVCEGDYVLPSGLHDGTGIAVSPGRMQPEQYAQVIGRAWESAEGEGLKTVNTAVGLPSASPIGVLISLLQAQQEELAALRGRLGKLRAD